MEIPQEYDTVCGDKTIDSGGRLSLTSFGGDVFLSAGTSIIASGATSFTATAGSAAISLAVAPPAADAIRAQLKAQGAESSGSIAALIAGIGAQEAEEETEEKVSGFVNITCGELGEVKISAGPPGEGAMIILTPESITFRVGEAAFTMTAASITEVVGEVTREMTNEGHNLTSGETELNVGLQGTEYEGPTDGKAVEAGTAEAQSLDAENTLGTSVTSVPLNTLE